MRSQPLAYQQHVMQPESMVKINVARRKVSRAIATQAAGCTGKSSTKNIAAT